MFRIKQLAIATALLAFMTSIGYSQSLTMLWNAGPSLQAPRDSGAAVVAGNNIYMFGGNTTVPTSVETLAFGAGAWTNSAALQTPRIGACASVPSFIGIVGGKDGRRAIRDLTSYIPNGQSSNVKSMLTARYLHACAYDSLGRINAIGGKDVAEAPTSTVEAFGGGRWTAIASLPETRYNFSATWDGVGSILTFGGSTPTSLATNTVNRLSLAGVWDTAAPMPIATSGSAVVRGANSLIYVIGGNDGTGPISAVQVYHVDTDTWTLGTPLPVAVSNASAVIDLTGKILVIGGVNASNASLSNTWSSPQDAARPVFNSGPNTFARAQTPYLYQASSTGNPAATYSLATAPAGMTIDGPTGVVSWTPTMAQIGVQNVTITATNIAGSTDQSFAITVDPPIPPTPTGLTATDITANSVTLTWNPVTSDFGPATYNVYERFCGGRSGCRYSPIASSGAATTLTINGLVSGGFHGYAVNAVVSGVGSPVSAPISVGTLQVAGPTNLVATGGTQSSVSMAWTPPAASSLPVAGYRVFEWVAAIGFVTKFDNIPDTTATVTGLLSNSAHLFYVCSLDANGNQSPILGPLQATTNSLPALFHNSAFPRAVGGGVYNETLSAVIGSNMMLVSAEAHSTAPVNYVISGAGSPAPTFSLVNAPAGMTIDPVSGLVTWNNVSGPVGTFTATARGTNVEGFTDFNFNYTVYPAGTDLLSPTTVLMFQAVVSNITRTTATITWNPVTDNVGVVGYRVYTTSPILVCGTASGCPPLPTLPPTIVTSGTTVNLTGLSRNTGYSYWIEAFDAAGNTSFITQGVQRNFITLN